MVRWLCTLLACVSVYELHSAMVLQRSGSVSWTLTPAAMVVYGPAELLVLNRHDVIPARPVRKSIFSLRLWQPAGQQSHSQRRLNSVTRPRRPFCTRPSAGTAAGLSWTLTRRSSSGLVRSTVQLCLVAVGRHYGSQMRPSRPVIMFMYAYLASPSRPISALWSM